MSRRIQKLAVAAGFEAKVDERAVSLLGVIRTRYRMGLADEIALLRGLLRARLYSRARSEGLLLLSQYPESYDIRFLYAIAIQETGDDALALKEMGLIIKRVPKHAPSLNYVGYVLAEQGRELKRAERLIRRALEIRPKESAYLDSLAWVLFKRGRYLEARKVLKRALKESPNHPELLFHQACIEFRLRKRDIAQQIYEKSLRLECDPKLRKKYQEIWKKLRAD